VSTKFVQIKALGFKLAPFRGPIYRWATSGPSWPSCLVYIVIILQLFCTHCPVLVDSRKLELETFHSLLGISWLQEAELEMLQAFLSTGCTRNLEQEILHAKLNTGWLQKTWARNITLIAQYWFAPGTLSKERYNHCSVLVGSRMFNQETLLALFSTGSLQEHCIVCCSGLS
jgi:hypothetical protein